MTTSLKLQLPRRRLRRFLIAPEPDRSSRGFRHSDGVSEAAGDRLLAPFLTDVSGARDHGVGILSLGTDLPLLETRHLVLESAGYRVYSKRSTATIEEELISGVGLVVLCHSIQQDEIIEVVASLRSMKPSLPILRLTTGRGGSLEVCDEVLPPLAGPRSLLTKIEQMLAEIRKPTIA